MYRQNNDWEREGSYRRDDARLGSHEGSWNQRGDFGNRIDDHRRWQPGNQRDIPQERWGYGQDSYGRMTEGGHYGNARGEESPRMGRGPKGYRRSDERIREEICDRLIAHGRVDAGEVEVKVSEGEVMLTGTVLQRGDKPLIEQIAESVQGVVEVHNRIRMQRGPAPREQDSDSSEVRPTTGWSTTATREEGRGGKNANLRN